MSEQQLTNKSILQQVDVKHYICNVVKRKIYNFKFTKKSMFCRQIFCLHSSTLVKIKLLALILQDFSKETDGDLHLDSQGTNVFVACKHNHSPFA